MNHFSRDSPASGYDDICIAEWWSPLNAASRNRHLGVVKTLLEAGANINQAMKVQ